MKFNMGCGKNKLKDFINVDKYQEADPDLLCDLEKMPWPIESDTADYILFNHSLEHMGQDPNMFINIIKEIYRISKKSAQIQINVPHPRHDNFISDPTHVRAITPMTIALFSKKQNDHWKSVGAANTPLAYYTGVDFEIIRTEQVLDPYFVKQLQSKVLCADDIGRLALEKNNVIVEYKFTLNTIKP